MKVMSIVKGILHIQKPWSITEDETFVLDSTWVFFHQQSKVTRYCLINAFSLFLGNRDFLKNSFIALTAENILLQIVSKSKASFSNDRSFQSTPNSVSQAVLQSRMIHFCMDAFQLICSQLQVNSCSTLLSSQIQDKKPQRTSSKLTVNVLEPRDRG